MTKPTDIAGGTIRLFAWLITYGQWPVEMLDHIDGNRANNVLSNLREATNALNQQNQRRAIVGSKTGVLGVHQAPSGKFTASIGKDGQQTHLGTFLNLEDARNAYVQAKRRLHEYCTL